MKILLTSLTVLFLFGCAQPQPVYVMVPAAPVQQAAPVPAPTPPTPAASANKRPTWVASVKLDTGVTVVLSTVNLDCPKDTYGLIVFRKPEDARKIGCWYHRKGDENVYVNYSDGDTGVYSIRIFTNVNPAFRGTTSNGREPRNKGKVTGV